MIKNFLNEKQFHTYEKINALKYSMRFSGNYDELPFIYVVTPTYFRPTQTAELTRYVKFSLVKKQILINYHFFF